MREHFRGCKNRQAARIVIQDHGLLCGYSASMFPLDNKTYFIHSIDPSESFATVHNNVHNAATCIRWATQQPTKDSIRHRFTLFSRSQDTSDKLPRKPSTKTSLKRLRLLIGFWENLTGYGTCGKYNLKPSHGPWQCPKQTVRRILSIFEDENL